jgi:hypothetical protein
MIAANAASLCMATLGVAHHGRIALEIVHCLLELFARLLGRRVLPVLVERLHLLLLDVRGPRGDTVLVRLASGSRSTGGGSIRPKRKRAGRRTSRDAVDPCWSAVM